jgi:hypothetical protein
MTTLQLIQKYNLLPQDLRKEVMDFIESLIKKAGIKTQVPSPESNDQLPVIWAEEPDVSALFGLRKKDPLNLKEIRRKAWNR